MKDGITVFSSRATDILVEPDGKIIATSEGGPALFIKCALEHTSVPFLLHENSKQTVEIEVHKDGEYGRIPTPARQRSIAKTNLVSSWCIVSTLLDEWVLQGSLPDYLFVDVQGYVRDGSDFGLKRTWPFSGEITEQIFCLKGTTEELRRIPAELLENQKESRMLVETRGKDGAIIYTGGKEYVIPGMMVPNLVNTVGAGDTFFAYYVAALYEKKNPQVAGNYAARKTAEFLMSKT